MRRRELVALEDWAASLEAGARGSASAGEGRPSASGPGTRSPGAGPDRPGEADPSSDEATWRAVCVDAPGAAERRELARVAGGHGIRSRDTLPAQLRELARIRFPSVGDEDRRAAFVEAALADGPGAYAGAWIHFPWRRLLVRSLDGDDYFDVVTDRNRQKITREEQLELRSRAIGVVGLSVGGEIAFTLAQEHLCGRLVLADFDTLDLSNLNRLTAGVGDLGTNKAVLLARRVAELDPWLDVDVHPEGLTEENAGRVLAGLDLLVEECDDLPMKVRMRELAIERGIDVVYGADEGGFLSVEPYSRGDVALFHGRLDGPPPSRTDTTDPADFWKKLTVWLGGWDVISERSRESVEAIGTTLNGYPQLAGEPRQAAGQVAHVARRLLLGERIPPMVVRHDLDALLEAGWGALDQPPGRSPVTTGTSSRAPQSRQDPS